MQLTKLGHACVRLEKDGAVLVIDPGAWSGDDAIGGAGAVLVTHEHPDHLVPGALRRSTGISRSSRTPGSPWTATCSIPATRSPSPRNGS